MELVPASFVGPFEDGNLVQVLLGGASWEAHHRLEDSIRDSHQVGHHRILVDACIEVVAAAVAADHLRIPPRKMLPLAVVPVGEVALPHKALQDIAEASSVLASFLITQRNMVMSAKG